MWKHQRRIRRCNSPTPNPLSKLIKKLWLEWTTPLCSCYPYFVLLNSHSSACQIASHVSRTSGQGKVFLWSILAVTTSKNNKYVVISANTSTTGFTSKSKMNKVQQSLLIPWIGFSRFLLILVISHSFPILLSIYDAQYPDHWKPCTMSACPFSSL